MTERFGVPITVRVEGIRELTRDLDELGRSQVPFATALALTRTGEHAKRMLYDEFRRKIDRPTPTVMNSLYLEPATKQKLSAMVWMKDTPLGMNGGGKNPYSMEETLEHHFRGGSRRAKMIELTLRRRGLIAASEFVMPGKAAKMDEYGNMSRGQIQQIYSQIGVTGSGYDNAATNSRRSKANVAKAGTIFWSHGVGAEFGPKLWGIISKGRVLRREQNLPKGAWVRDGNRVSPLLIVVKKTPTYKRLFDLRELGQAAIDKHFNNEFDKALATAIKTAGKLGAGASRADRMSDWRTRAYR
jgi:hypothetical protein